jgi:hypothetical protein
VVFSTSTMVAGSSPTFFPSTRPSENDAIMLQLTTFCENCG